MPQRQLTCIIVDDEPIAREGIAEYVSRTPGLECSGQCRDIASLCEMLKSRVPDIIFLDMEMPGTPGVEFMRTYTGSAVIVPVTAYSRYALDGFDSNVADFLLKPVSYPRFATAVEKIRGMERTAPTVVVKEGRNLLRIPVSSIIMLEAMENYVKLHTPSGVHTVRNTLRNMLAALPDGEFAITHKSYAVNISAIEALETERVVLRGGKTAPLSKNHRREMSDLMLKFATKY